MPQDLRYKNLLKLNCVLNFNTKKPSELFWQVACKSHHIWLRINVWEQSSRTSINLQTVMHCRPGLDPGSMTSQAYADALVHGLRLKAAMTNLRKQKLRQIQAACTDAPSGCTASLNPIALRMADRLLSAGLPFGESVR